MAPEDEACSGGRSHWNLGVWALFLSSICGGFWEETLGSEGGVLAWLVCVKNKQTNQKKQRFPGRAWMMNATHVT